MTITKEKLIGHINQLPKEIEMEALIERLLFIEKLEKRIALSKQGETISEKELENEMAEWFKSIK
jgi:hypothetical protein